MNDAAYIARVLRDKAVDVDSLTADSRPRTHGTENRLNVRRSLKRFGQLRTIVVWQKKVLAGRTVWAMTKELGRAKIAVTDVTYMDEQQARAYALADNRTAEDARWDQPQLLANLADMDEDLRQAAGFPTVDFGGPDVPNEPEPQGGGGGAPRPEPQGEALRIDLTAEQAAIVDRAVSIVRSEQETAKGHREAECVARICKEYTL